MFVIVSIVAIVTNAAMDAIDHSKGSETLRYVWHGLKWPIFLPCLFLAGVYFEFEAWFILYVAGLLFLWEFVYSVLMWVFKKYGVPWWF